MASSLLQVSAQSCKSIIDSLFYAKRGLKNFPELGVSIALIVHDSVFYYNYGNRNRETSLPADSNTIYEIGSNTKLFTALLLATDLESGVIKRGAMIDAYLPHQLKLAPGIVHKIRLTDLASYASGLPTLHDDRLDSILLKKDSLQPYAAIDRSFLLKILQETDSLTGYGTYLYSNYSFGLLGCLLKDYHKEAYSALLRKRILQPLQMNHTTTGYRHSVLAAGGYDSKGNLVGYLQLNELAPAGVLKSNATDLVHFLRAQIHPPANELGKAIGLTQAVFLDTPDMKAGLGWHIVPQEGSNHFVMFGDTIGNSSALGFNRDKKLGIVVLLNQQQSDLRQAIYNYLYDKLSVL